MFLAFFSRNPVAEAADTATAPTPSERAGAVVINLSKTNTTSPVSSWAGTSPASYACIIIVGGDKPRALLRLYHLLRFRISSRFQFVVQYTRGVQKRAIKRDRVLALRELSFLLVHHSARFIED